MSHSSRTIGRRRIARDGSKTIAFECATCGEPCAKVKLQLRLRSTSPPRARHLPIHDVLSQLAVCQYIESYWYRNNRHAPGSSRSKFRRVHWSPSPNTESDYLSDRVFGTSESTAQPISCCMLKPAPGRQIKLGFDQMKKLTLASFQFEYMFPSELHFF